MGDLIDKEKELARLNKDRESCERDIAMISGKLENQEFVSKAPEKVVNNEKAKLARAKERLEKILSSTRELG